MLLPKIKKIPKNTNGRLGIPALAGLLVNQLAVIVSPELFTLILAVPLLFAVVD